MKVEFSCYLIVLNVTKALCNANCRMQILLRNTVNINSEWYKAKENGNKSRWEDPFKLYRIKVQEFNLFVKIG